MTEYALASAQRKEALQVVFSGFLNAAYLGLWNTLEAIMFGILLSGMSVFLQREQRMLGIVSRALAFFAPLDDLGRIVNVDAIFFVGVGGMLLFPVWLPWSGADLL